MKELFLDYVIYNPQKDYVIRWQSDKSIVIYGDKEEAQQDCNDEEIIMQCNQLPHKYKAELILKFKKFY
jgi:hypothetical protein